MNPKTPQKIARILFALAALFSIAAGIGFFVNYPQINIAIRLGMSGLLTLHGLILFALGWMVAQTPPRYPRLAAGFVFLSLIAFIFDDLGPIDSPRWAFIWCCSSFASEFTFPQGNNHEPNSAPEYCQPTHAH